MKKRIFTVFLAGCFAFGIVSCGSEKQSDTVNAPVENTDEETDEETGSEVSAGTEDAAESLDTLEKSEQQEEMSDTEPDEEEQPQDIRNVYWETDAEASRNFERIETTEPVTLKSTGVSVTVSLPSEVEDYETFEHISPTDVFLENGRVEPRFSLNNTSGVEGCLADGRDFYANKVKNNEKRPNGRISNIYKLDTDNGQISVLKIESEEINVLGKTGGYISYYAALPLNNGVTLRLLVVDSYDLEEGTPYTDDAIVTMFNHCTIGSYEP